MLERRAHRCVPTSPASIVLTLVILLGACAPPTQGPVVDIDGDAWTASPSSMVQEREWFEVTVVNNTESDARFVVIRLEFGEVTDLPRVDGLVEIDRSGEFVTGPIEFEPYEPGVMGPLVVAYHLVYPDLPDVDQGMVPVLAAGERQRVRVGNRGLGGGDPGRYAVVSYEPGAIERGDYVVFDLTDVDGDVPRIDPVEFCIPHPYEPLRVGDRIPRWEGLLLDGGEFHSETLAGHPALIFVFGAHRPDDVDVLSTFVEAAETHAAEINVVMVENAAAGNEEAIARLLEAAGVSTPVVFDDTCVLQAVFRIGWEEPPYWIMTDDEGVITGLEYGPRSLEEIRTLIDAST